MAEQVNEYNRKKFFDTLIANSISKDVKQAMREWEVSELIITPDDDPNAVHHCICGHEIWYNCIIDNKKNQNRLIVGSTCVKQFLAIETGDIFGAVAKIRKDITKAANEALIEYLDSKNWLNEFEYNFLTNTKTKRKLSEKQMITRKKINSYILRKMIRAFKK